ncbi:MAG: helix-turn-helix domain-containing protein [Chloroflexota bacterium]
MSQESLLSISEASQLLGVSEAALRQWTDEGKIKAFITPGGHRRYSRTELKKFTGAHPRTLGIKDVVLELEDTVQALRETSRTMLNATHWYQRLGEDSREQMAQLGRQLLRMIIRYITEPSRREENRRLTREVGRNLGQTLAHLDLPLTDAVEAFLMHREPIMQAVTHLLRKREAFTGRVVEAIPLVAHIMDEALVSLVSAHQQYRNGAPPEIPGGNH